LLLANSTPEFVRRRVMVIRCFTGFVKAPPRIHLVQIARKRRGH